MPTKKKKAAAKKRKAPAQPKPEVLSVNGRDERYLEILIAASERAIDGRGGSLDELFTNQANRLKAELEELRSRK